MVASVNERGRQLRQPLCVMRFFCLSFAFLSLGFARSMHFAPYNSQRGDQAHLVFLRGTIDTEAKAPGCRSNLAINLGQRP